MKFNANLTINPSTGHAMLPARYLNNGCTVKLQSLSALRYVAGIEQVIPDVPVFLAEKVEYFRSPDWEQGPDGLRTRVSVVDGIPVHDRVWIVSKRGAIYYLPQIDSEHYLWDDKSDKKWFLFIQDRNNSNIEYTERLISIAERGL